MSHFRRFAVAAALALMATGSAFATCQGTNGHTARMSSRWPFSEDIANASATPYGDLSVSYNSWQWTTIQSGCVDLGEKNLFASESFNAFVRAQPTIIESTLPLGTLWESQLVLVKPDGTEAVAAWDARRTNGTGTYRQADHFGGVVSALPAGQYSYRERVRVIDNVSGYMKFENQWTTGLGVPASDYPSGGTVYNGQQVVSSTWIPVGNVLTIPANAAALDLSVVGTWKIDAGTPGTPLQIGFSIDGQSSGSQYGLVAVPASMPNGVTAFDYKINLAANVSHTLQMWMQAPSGSVTIELPGVSYVAYANSKAVDLSRDEAEIRAANSAIVTTPVRVDAFTTQAQPITSNLSPVCGKWTKLAEFDVPGPQASSSTNTALTAVINGYVQFAGNVVGNRRGELAIEVLEYDENGVYATAELGVSAVWAPNGSDGMYFSSDGIWSNFAGYDHVNLWMRQISDGCAGGGLGSGGWDVGKRYFSLKFLPSPGSQYQ